MDAVSGSISDNKMTFFHQTFIGQLSQRAIIEVDVYCHRRPIPILGIYTTQDHVNIKKGCTESPY